MDKIIETHDVAESVIQEQRLNRMAFEIRRREEKRKKVGKLVRETFDKKTRQAMDEMRIQIVSFIGESIHQARTYGTSLWYYFLCISCERKVYVKRMPFGFVVAICNSCCQRMQDAEQPAAVPEVNSAVLDQNLTV